MSDREKAKILIDQIPEYKIELVLAYLQGVFDGASEIPNDQTIEAFKEIEEGGGHLFSGSIEDLLAELAEEYGCSPRQIKYRLEKLRGKLKL